MHIYVYVYIYMYICVCVCVWVCTHIHINKYLKLFCFQHNILNLAKNNKQAQKIKTEK